VLTRLHAAEVARIAEDIEPAAVIVDSEWLAANGGEWIPATVERIFIVGDTSGLAEGHLALTEFIAGGSDDELPAPTAESIAWVQYTSGSTGKPKGVLTSQGAVGAMVRNAIDEVEFRPEDVSLHTAPISHFSGTVLMDTNAVGALNILESGFELDQVIEYAEGGEVTVLPLVPTMITMLVEELGRRGEPGGRVGAVRMLPYAGSAIQPDRAARAVRFFGEVMTQFYGSSESPLPVTVLHPADHVDEEHLEGISRLASAGRPASNVDVRIIDTDGIELPAGEQGEIEVASEQVSSGYWKQPEATAETFAGGRVRTGDVGCFDEDGFLYILDRRKDMIVTGGFNVYPREVENAISTLPGVREVAVVGAPHERWGEVITAVVAPEPEAELSAEQVIAHCRTSIGGYKVPKRVEFVAELPKSGAGKILKPQLREELWADRARKV
jgi:acyl-CoA synthetase (AMP-forming)/AMP-acid ligase II